MVSGKAGIQNQTCLMLDSPQTLSNMTALWWASTRQLWEARGDTEEEGGEEEEEEEKEEEEMTAKWGREQNQEVSQGRQHLEASKNSEKLESKEEEHS